MDPPRPHKMPRLLLILSAAQVVKPGSTRSGRYSGEGEGGGWLALRGEPAPRLSSVAPSLPSVTVDRRQISIVKKLTWPAPRLAISSGLQMNYRFRQETVGGEELTSDLDAKLTNLVW